MSRWLIAQPDVAVLGANPDSTVPIVFGRRIAKGGMGEILEGSDCKLGRQIAVKVMLDARASVEQARRFVQEAAVLGKLEHPNVVPIHDLGRDSDGFLYHTMKLVKGRTLQAIIDDLRREDQDVLEHFTLDRLLTIFHKVCDALSFAHSKGIIHRDLKPENIMVGEFGEVLVMDWGIAKVLGEPVMKGSEDTPVRSDAPDSNNGLECPRSSTASFTATMDGAVMGTPNYMSPEQAMGKVSELDERSDIFSLGGILYAILTLRPPVEGKDVWEVLEKVQTANITAPTEHGATTGRGMKQKKGEVLEAMKIKPLPHCAGGRVPPALSAVAMKALKLDKGRRYQNVTAFSSEIELYQGGFATSAEKAGFAKQMVLLIRRNKGIFTTAAAAWCIVMALAVWFVVNLRAEEKRAIAGEENARAAEAIAVREREATRQALAKSQLDLAEKEFERGKFVEAKKILQDTPECFRDANWRFLSAHSSDFSAQLSLPGKGGAHRMQFLGREDRFAVRCWAGVIGIFDLKGRHIGGWIPVSGDYSACFGIDRAGARLALIASPTEAAVVDVNSGEIVRRWTTDLSEIKHVLLSADGGTVLAVGVRQISAYAALTGEQLWKAASTSIIPAVSPDGRTVAVLAAKDGVELKVQILDMATGQVRNSFEATADSPDKTTLQFNEKGDRLACFGGNEIILWNPEKGMKVSALHFPGEQVRLLSPGGNAVVTVKGSRIRLWESATGRLQRSLHGAVTDVMHLAFSADGRMLLSSHVAAKDAVLHVWPVRLWEETATGRGAVTQSVNVVFNLEGSRFYGCALNAWGWESRGGREAWKFSTGPVNVWDLAIHPADGSILVSEFKKPSFAHVSLSGEKLERFGASWDSSVEFNRDGRLLLCVDQAFAQINPGAGFSVMEYPSGKVMRKMPFRSEARQPFAVFCLDDAAVASAALAGGINVWNWKEGTALHRISAEQTGSIGCLAASADGRRLATGGPDRWLRVWDAATGRLETAFRAHWEGVRCVRFSPDGMEILSGSEDGTVRLHDAATGEERLVFYGLTGKVGNVDMSADGRLIAAISSDGIAKVWDRLTARAAAMLPERDK